jgi:acetyl esterase/lipase
VGRILLRMKLLTVLLAAILLPATLFAQQPKPKPNVAPGSIAATPIPAGSTAVERLWPGKAPGAIGDTYDDIPVLYTYPASGPGPHTAVIVLPGGGYNHLVTEQEGAREARWLNTHGITAFVLIYRLSPRYMYPAAMLDGQRAVRFVRAHAAEWNVRPEAIGVWGFSAGGHLAGYLATSDPRALVSLHPLDTIEMATHRSEMMPQTDTIDALSARPDFAILSYARVDLDAAIPGTFGMEAITGKNAPQTMLDAIDPVKHVTKGSSPSFIYATERDEKVNSLNATSFFNALQRAGVDAELHIFQLGPHGTHMGDDQPKYPELGVTPLLIAHWLQFHGWMSADAAP